MSAVEQKVAAIGTSAEKDAAESCSAVIMKEYEEYKARMRAKLGELRLVSKRWWTLSRELMQLKGHVSSIPALRSADGT